MSSQLVELTEADLEKIRQLIYDATGMRIDKKKDYYLINRLRQRIAALGSSSFERYYHEVIYNESKTELSLLIESLTINETYFFRDFPQLQGFAEVVLPPYVERKRSRGENSLRVWSAACSTGEEPYTLGIILKEMLDDAQAWHISVLATDIDKNVLHKAKLAEYEERSMRDTPLPYRSKYFQRRTKDWTVLPDISRMITFEQLNLVDRGGMRSKRGFDFIFCRNVLIYFDETSTKRVLNYLYDALNPGGYIFLGHSESVGRSTAMFELERAGGFLCYKRPEKS